MGLKNKRVLLIGSTLNYMLNSIIGLMKEKGVEVSFSSVDINSVNSQGKNYDCFLFFLDEDVVSNNKALVYIKDLATEESIPIFITGYDEEIRSFLTVVPEHLIANKYQRPINVSDMVHDLCGYLTNHDNSVKKKILVVDDSGAALRTVKGWLEDKYKVILASSGVMAIKYMVQDNPDLILLDYEMPVCDGKQVLEMIRAESDFSNVPVIFLTAKGDRESIMDVLKLKPDGYLLKSMEPDDIVKAIDEFFEKRKALANVK